jgi:hypothetical protein
VLGLEYVTVVLGGLWLGLNLGLEVILKLGLGPK